MLIREQMIDFEEDKDFHEHLRLAVLLLNEGIYATLSFGYAALVDNSAIR